MVDQDALLAACADYASTVLGRYDMAEVLERLTEQVTEVLDVPGAGVAIGGDDGTLRFATASDETVMQVEESQLEKDEGPCHDAWRRGAIVTEPDLTSSDRWPAFRPVALVAGWQAVAGVPMVIQGETVGALNLYHRNAHEWTAEELRAAKLLADMAAGYIVNVRTFSETARLAEQLQHALDSRVVIEQAKGVLAGRHGIETKVAFELLRKHARDRGRRIHDVAQEVLEGHLEL
jgi:GAF domain-containing protein